MSEVKHTPGPWRRCEYSEIRADRPDDDDSVVVAALFCTPLGGIDGERPLDVHEAEANANLITAAPDLLEALKALMGHDEQLQVSIGGNPIYVDAFMDKCRATITSAEGGER